MHEMSNKKPAKADYRKATAAEPEQALLQLRRWYASRQGQYTLQAVQSCVGKMITDVFGYYALEIGGMPDTCHLLQESRIVNCFRMVPDGSLVAKAGLQADFIGTSESLPVAFDSLDLVIGCHVLDMSAAPHQVLREIERVLLPEGHCVLVGFNPVSLLGLRRFWRQLFRHQTPGAYTAFRVRDWFEVLGFEVLETRTIGFRSGFWRDGLFRRMAWMERLGERSRLGLGNVHVIHVRKRGSRLTPIRPRMHPRPILNPGMAINSGAGRMGKVTGRVDKQQHE